MLTPEQVEALRAFDARGARVLSVYLDLEAVRQGRPAYRVVFEDLVRAARERLDEPARAALAEEAARVRAWLDDRDPGGRGLAVFACSPRGLWQVHRLAVRVRDHLAFEPAPDVAPLLELFDEYERYAVALVDKEHARLFTVFLGEIEEREAFEDFVPGKHDQGGWSQARYQRHHEAHVYWHLKRVVERLAGLARRRQFDRLVLAGPEEAISELRRLLPRPLARRLAAVIRAEMTAGDREILDKTLAVEQQLEREAEERLVEQILDQAGPGGRAVLGVESTLEALSADAVQTLVVAPGEPRAGGECPECGWLEADGRRDCPLCGSAVEPRHDIAHRAMERAREQAARVEVVHGEAARRLAEVGGGMGALLRYPSPGLAQARHEAA
jgi:peptide chain release factor subunit 1